MMDVLMAQLVDVKWADWKVALLVPKSAAMSAAMREFARAHSKD